MKALLLKDFYTVYNSTGWKRFLLIFAAITVYCGIRFSPYDDNSAIVLPGILACCLPFLLYSKNGRWSVYTRTLPISNLQYSTEKYLLGLLSVGFLLVIFTPALAIRFLTVNEVWFRRGTDWFGTALVAPPSVSGYFSVLLIHTAVSLGMQALLLPFSLRFRSGVAVLVLFGIIMTVLAALSTAHIRLYDIPLDTSALALLAAAILYTASWGLSTVLRSIR